MEKINSVQLCGGIGNQLFQYAFGRVQTERGIKVFYNLIWYKKKQLPPRPYRLGKFNTIVHLSLERNQKLVREKGFDLGYLKNTNCYFTGYWQYLAYFKSILPILQKEFWVRKEFYTPEFIEFKEQILSTESVSVHVRRQDYINRQGFGALPLKYYFEAFKKVKGDLFIFSDDLDWCKKVFDSDYFTQKITFVSVNDFLDFELMRLCKHHILANSTFSWWAAILDDDLKKKVVCPSNWLLCSGELGNRGNFPKHWIKI
jgi:hypothetical protein